jgi:hypothetical protein
VESSALVDATPARVVSRPGAVGLRALGEDAPFLLIVACYAASAFALSALVGLPRDFSLAFNPGRWKLSAASTFVFGFLLFFTLLVREVVARQNSIRAPATWGNVVRGTFPLYKTLNYAVILLVLPTLAGVFTAFKMSITEFIPFGYWDAQFMEWDRILHFGIHPYVLFDPLLGHPVVTKLLDLAYYVWFPVIWVSLVWQAWHGSRESATRSQYLVAFALCWILLGSLAAIAFSSAGPVYYGEVVSGGDPYAELMRHLHLVDAEYSLKSLWAHELLWQSYVDGKLIEFGGISAMPSLHVSMCVLLAILGFNVDRRIGWAYTVFAVLIFLGSFQLAWHYAIDGYVAAIGTAGIWWFSGKVVRSWRTRIGLPT